MVLGQLCVEQTHKPTEPDRNLEETPEELLLVVFGSKICRGWHRERGNQRQYYHKNIVHKSFYNLA